ncbi:hypothetical protein TIFTF001_004212 [Ficus carica]|uniref:Uncharacterized protein n=1 Tax=Ficus carica TaxID=3494 RepID=A0AA87ZX01_FICCA|nr:hypothetical protein TIFTF001_004212 [Ficus carica]
MRSAFLIGGLGRKTDLDNAFLVVDHDSLWSKYYQDKYLKGASFQDFTGKKSDSSIWKSIISMRDIAIKPRRGLREMRCQPTSNCQKLLKRISAVVAELEKSLLATSSNASPNSWLPPSPPWIKQNVDAAVRYDHADQQEHLIFVHTTLPKMYSNFWLSSWSDHPLGCV